MTKVIRVIILECLILGILIVQYNIYLDSKQQKVYAKELVSITEQLDREYAKKERLELFELDLREESKKAQTRIAQREIINEYVENKQKRMKENEEAWKKWKEEVWYNTPQYTFFKNYDLTAYCKCSICCGHWSNVPGTASGATPVEGVTIAVNGVPFGTELYIEGYGTYIVQDTGGMGSNVIDVYFSSHEAACNFGRKNNVAVYKVSYPKRPK